MMRTLVGSRLLPLLASVLLGTSLMRADDPPPSPPPAPPTTAQSSAPPPNPGEADDASATKAAEPDTADDASAAAADAADTSDGPAAMKPPEPDTEASPAEAQPEGAEPDAADADAPAEPDTPAVESAPVEEPIGELYDLGAQLFETFAPDEIKERYRFPTREEWDSFSVRLVDALESPSLHDLAEMEPDARAALDALRALPDYAEYADWLEDRLDDISVAQEVSAEPPSERAAPPDAASLPEPEPEIARAVPLYDVWLERMRRRPPPVRAAQMVPRLKPVFEQASLPAALVWMAETESSFNPAARSPVGARGLFQLMPGTAKDLGLRLFPFDERLDPLKNASSAARYLSKLYARFDDWPLALAAYNAGPSRVSRTLKKHDARTFAEIAEHLPSETRLYVPKVLATVAVREGVTLAALGLHDSTSETRVEGSPSTPSSGQLAARQAGF